MGPNSRWNGVLILLILIATTFLGYVLALGQRVSCFGKSKSKSFEKSKGKFWEGVSCRRTLLRIQFHSKKSPENKIKETDKLNFL